MEAPAPFGSANSESGGDCGSKYFSFSFLI
jgi:hypothetical protein